MTPTTEYRASQKVFIVTYVIIANSLEGTSWRYTEYKPLCVLCMRAVTNNYLMNEGIHVYVLVEIILFMITKLQRSLFARSCLICEIYSLGDKMKVKVQSTVITVGDFIWY